MNTSNNILKEFGLNTVDEISQALRGLDCPQEYNPIVDFSIKRNERIEWIESLTQMGFLQSDISNYKVLEIGGGLCHTAAAFADKSKSVVSFELEEVHCLYAKKCKEHFDIHNLAIFMGSIIGIQDSNYYPINHNSVDLVISYLGMFKSTVIESLETISKMLISNGKFIFVYPRFWTNDSDLQALDQELLNRAMSKNQDWLAFEKLLKENLNQLDFKIEHEAILENHEFAPIGGDVIIGSNIAATREEYMENPIEDLFFGKSLMTCNTLICSKL